MATQQVIESCIIQFNMNWNKRLNKDDVIYHQYPLFELAFKDIEDSKLESAVGLFIISSVEKWQPPFGELVKFVRSTLGRTSKTSKDKLSDCDQCKSGIREISRLWTDNNDQYHITIYNCACSCMSGKRRKKVKGLKMADVYSLAKSFAKDEKTAHQWITGDPTRQDSLSNINCDVVESLPWDALPCGNALIQEQVAMKATERRRER
tara:strand:- start:2348 stop:2968 length:621 start_codon:yes stop_codon:yes gene_type:complete